MSYVVPEVRPRPLDSHTLRNGYYKVSNGNWGNPGVSKTRVEEDCRSKCFHPTPPPLRSSVPGGSIGRYKNPINTRSRAVLRRPRAISFSFLMEIFSYLR